MKSRLVLTAALLFSGLGARAAPPQESRPAAAVAVVQAGLDPKNPEHARFAAVARAAATFHRAPAPISFDGRSVDALRADLVAAAPDAVLMVVPPETLDVNLHRRLLLLSATLDDDLFPDFTFGYLTARDGAALEKLWKRTVRLHEKGLRSRVWHSTGVISKGKSYVYPNARSALEKAAGFTGENYYFGVVENDPDVLKFADRTLPRLEEAGVVEMSGNGDPQGVWLFADDRNLDASKHWPFDPAKVGHDPKGEMPRLLAPRFAKLDLDGAVVWSGTCHSAAPRRVFIEGDIVSTFGKTKGPTLYELKPKESLCLAILDAGAAAFLAPIAANHGLAAMREQETFVAAGASLGESVKATYDAVFLAAKGRLRLDFADQPGDGAGEKVMQGGGANRILIGDPTLRLCKPTPHPTEKTEIRRATGDAFVVTTTWQKGFHAAGWDMFGTDSARGACVSTRVAIDDVAPPRIKAFTATVAATGADGVAMPYVFTHAEVETFAGRRYLHLQANAPRTEDNRFAKVTFSVAPAGDASAK
jgi:hypothetical protein